MKLTIDIPKIPEEEKTELVVLLLEIIRQQGEIIQSSRMRSHVSRVTIQSQR